MRVAGATRTLLEKGEKIRIGSQKRFDSLFIFP